MTPRNVRGLRPVNAPRRRNSTGDLHRSPALEHPPRPWFERGGMRLPSADRIGQLFAAVSIVIVLGWLAAIFLVDPVRFVVSNPRGKTGFEMFLALGQLFGALVLALSPDDATRPRLRWVAAALLILGLGALGFGYLYPLVVDAPAINVTMYGSLVIRTLATGCLVIGMLPSRAPGLSPRLVAASLAISGAICLAIIRLGEELPVLVHNADLESISSTTKTSFPGLTDWHLALNLVPLALGIAAVWGTMRHAPVGPFGGWLIAAIVLFTGSQLHTLFWPSMYSSVLTTTSVLRFGLTLAVVVGSIFELRALSLERAALLADEQQRVRELQTLDTLRRDFSSMVAHELATPLAAITNMAQIITLGAFGPQEQQRAASKIQAEARILQLLVRDIQASADVERDDFTVDIRPVALPTLFDDAEAFAQAVQAHHPLRIEPAPDFTVNVDPERIGQVIRNLLNNAVRHTPAGTPVTLCAHPENGHVRIEIADRGQGIDPTDRALILEKFGRGATGGHGRGLGLYVSQRILQAHGADLLIESEPGQGARFSFPLEVCQ